MKLFLICTEDDSYDRITADMSQLIISICERITNRLDVCHLALYLFHCQAKVATYHRFDRFLYSCAAVLIATKLSENLKYPMEIIKVMRALLRTRRGIEGEDTEQKLKIIQKKVFEAEVTIMINIGFDFDIELGLYSLREWEKQIKDTHLIRKIQQTLTSLYQTNVVVYYSPADIAMTALALVLKNEGLVLEMCGWDLEFIEKIKLQSRFQKEITQDYLHRRRFFYQ